MAATDHAGTLMPQSVSEQTAVTECRRRALPSVLKIDRRAQHGDHLIPRDLSNDAVFFAQFAYRLVVHDSCEKRPTI
jgi:hypothetical protein